MQRIAAIAATGANVRESPILLKNSGVGRHNEA
jgi:hypothetical protein